MRRRRRRGFRAGAGLALLGLLAACAPLPEPLPPPGGYLPPYVPPASPQVSYQAPYVPPDRVAWPAEGAALP